MTRTSGAEPPGSVPAFDQGRFIIVDATGGRLVADGVAIADLTPARSLPGRHNAQNAAFAYAAARAVGVSHDAAVEGLMTFPGLAHRMETVGTLGPVRFVNDSKATNADAARQALMSYPTAASGSRAGGPRTAASTIWPTCSRA